MAIRMIEYTVNGTKYTNNTTAYFTQDVFITGNLSVGGDLVVTGSITAGGLKVLANIDVDGIVTAGLQRKGLAERIPAEIENADGSHKPVKFIKLTDEGYAFDPDAEVAAE